MSEDLSNHSESNSEQWEPGGTPLSNHELYDALRRVSSDESISSYLELEEIADGSIRIDCNTLQYPNEPMPPPPVPPLQWQIVKLHFAAEEDKQFTVSDALNHPMICNFWDRPLSNLNQQQDQQKFNGPREATQAATVGRWMRGKIFCIKSDPCCSNRLTCDSYVLFALLHV
ncbi:hypothetical protein HHK36_003590 [Tetracentron sinense]|uniref:Uncharacterized protein n=1 Tax=Tetracentron sinense TaxID=13715 RepID=A0A834ZY20_TETSI|nr:hypothetical protein HHK36_003590 [Tetracentron sinense]